MARWDISSVQRIGPGGATITVRFRLAARFTQAADQIDMIHIATYQRSVTGADFAAKRANLISQIEAPGTGILAVVKANQIAEESKAVTETTFEITDRDAGAVA